MGLISIPLVIVGGVLGLVQLTEALDTPDVELVFGTPKEPRFWVVNVSSSLAREPFYQLLFFDLSVANSDGTRLNLEIPTKSVGYIRPDKARGPWTIRSVARQGARILEGHDVFGYAQVQCPTCEAVRHYWVFAQVGNTGWYAEIAEDELISVTEKLNGVVFGGPDYADKIRQLVPSSRQIPMASTH